MASKLPDAMEGLRRVVTERCPACDLPLPAPGHVESQWGGFRVIGCPTVPPGSMGAVGALSRIAEQP